MSMSYATPFGECWALEGIGCSIGCGSGFIHELFFRGAENALDRSKDVCKGLAIDDGLHCSLDFLRGQVFLRIIYVDNASRTSIGCKVEL